MCINLSGPGTLMTKQFLDVPYVKPTLMQMRCITVPQTMYPYVLLNACTL